MTEIVATVEPQKKPKIQTRYIAVPDNGWYVDDVWSAGLARANKKDATLCDECLHEPHHVYRLPSPDDALTEERVRAAAGDWVHGRFPMNTPPNLVNYLVAFVRSLGLLPEPDTTKGENDEVP